MIENQEFLRIYKAEGRARAKESGLGSPLSFKFKRDRKGWRVMVSLRMPTPEVITSSRAGLIGVDINSDHLAVSETDRAGNWLSSCSIPPCTYGKSKDQALALIGDAAKDLVQIAHSRGKSLVLERLGFSEKKAGLREESPKYARMLSSFAYSRVKAFILSRALRMGVAVHQINPAFSSLIGRFKFQERYGLTTHQAAALVLARRYAGFSEAPPPCLKVRDKEGVQFTLPAPVRKPGRHVWSFWADVSGELDRRTERIAGGGNSILPIRTRSAFQGAFP